MTRTLTSTDRRRLPAEFIGKARQFRARVSAADDAFRNVARQTVYPLKALWQVAPQHVIRPKTLHRVLHRWQHELSPVGRLRLDAQLHASDLLIAEHRITVGRKPLCSPRNRPQIDARTPHLCAGHTVDDAGGFGL